MPLRRASALLALFASVLLGAAMPPPQVPLSTSARLLATPLPARDPSSVAARFRHVSPSAQFQRSSEPPVVGGQESFWIVDQRTASMFEASATLRLVSEHAYWFVQTSENPRVLDGALTRSAVVFEDRTYPFMRDLFGPAPPPGQDPRPGTTDHGTTAINGDPRLAILLTRIPGIAAYFSGVDTFPRSVYPRSNERDLVYMNVDVLSVGQAGFDATLVHEMQHLVQFARCPVQETWVDEGTSELASKLAGYPAARAQAFALRPELQLTAWGATPNDMARHYQASRLFQEYVLHRFGGPGVLPDLYQGCARGTDLFDAFFGRRGAGVTFDDVFLDWAVANLVGEPGNGDPRYSYPNDGLQMVTTRPRIDETTAVVLPQYAASYLELPTEARRITFRGDPEVAVLGTTAPSGVGMWWSNRADSLDSRLTRQVDLTSMASAMLRFQTWYDIEPGFDFAYLAVSRDGGGSWQALPGLNTVTDEGIGNAVGPGWTGVSGDGPEPAWVDEEIDLTPFVGGSILLRFEYLTDQGYNAQGFALDNLEIRELGLMDQAEDNGPWLSEGWVRIDGPLAERWRPRLVSWVGDAISVDDLPVGEDGSAALDLPAGADRRVLVVVVTAPRTLQPGRFTVDVHTT